jgi:hypothetical protein
MKSIDAANDNLIERQIIQTRKVWRARLRRDLSDDDTRQLIHSFTGFFGVLAEWSRAEKLSSANDAATHSASKEGEVRHER